MGQFNGGNIEGGRSHRQQALKAQQKARELRAGRVYKIVPVDAKTYKEIEIKNQ